tara:strand:- start:4290 stop:5048 length:759 start_codon:yes stop_codon:yes gene_type:complete
MKVVILSGGFGTRLSEYTEVIPKPMVRIGNIPILVHIMNIYSKFDQKDFYLALGYKSDVIKDFFLNYREINSDFSVNLKSGELSIKNQKNLDWDVTLVNTGLNTFTGGRIKRMKEFIGNETFLLTYGDGLADIDIDALISFHKNHGKMVTVTAVHPVARFGELDLKNERVVSFKEKPQIAQGWINGGYFVIEPEFFEFIEDDSTILEKEPLERVSKMGELMAFKHEGFWQCLDTKRDKDYLEDLWASGKHLW